MTKKVRFFTGVEIDKNQERHSWSAGAWRRFIDSCIDEPLAFEIRGRRVAGKSETCVSPVVSYLHVTKSRELSDWPEAGDTEGVISNLATRREQAGISSILEYTYLLPVSGTPYVAILRSSSGPMPSIVASWIALKMDLQTKGSSFELQPVLRKDARRKLDESLGVKSLEVRFEGRPNQGSDSCIERAAAEAVSVVGEDYANVSVDLRISTGRATLVGPATDGVRKEALSILKKHNVFSSVKEIFNEEKITKLRANTIQQGKDSDKPITETVDFIRECLTEDVDFGSKKDDEMTSEIILSGMMEAILKFRKREGEYD